MESSKNKRELSAYILLLFGTALMIKSHYARTESFVIQEELAETEALETLKEQKLLSGEEIIFWYYGSENKEFFENCAEEFQEETGIAVSVEEQQSLNYFSGVYDASKTGEDMPDVYLLPAEQLEQAYLTQVLSANDKDLPENCAKMAESACALREDGKLYGYPLYFNTSVFAYRTDYFENSPVSIQEIIDFSIEHEPTEGVEKLLEWDLSDACANFAFLGDGITFGKAEGCITPEYGEEEFEACKTFFGNLTAVIALDEEELSSRKVAEDFAEGKTVAVLLPAEELGEPEGNFGVEMLPKLNEELPMCAVSETTVVCVNGMTEKNQAAQEFASYVSSLASAEKLSEMTGHMPVIQTALKGELQDIAYRQYENGRAKPDGLNVTDFWVKFQSQALKVWHDAE
ncbi:MAG: extracellular solute-binding protein [Roseburia sp.]|nr:extracellular solute-binding protein [Roseburia sp.]